jgi:hypothetical protein
MLYCAGDQALAVNSGIETELAAGPDPFERLIAA